MFLLYQLILLIFLGLLSILIVRHDTQFYFAIILNTKRDDFYQKILFDKMYLIKTKHLRPHINLYRMCFADFSVNSQPIFLSGLFPGHPPNTMTFSLNNIL